MKRHREHLALTALLAISLGMNPTSARAQTPATTPADAVIRSVPTATDEQEATAPNASAPQRAISNYTVFPTTGAETVTAVFRQANLASVARTNIEKPSVGDPSDGEVAQDPPIVSIHIALGSEAQTIWIRNIGQGTNRATIEYVSEDGSIIRSEPTPSIPWGNSINFVINPDPDAVGVTIKSTNNLLVKAEAPYSFDSKWHVIVPGLIDVLPATRTLFLWNYSQNATSVALAAIDTNRNFSAHSSVLLAPGQSVRMQLTAAFSGVNPAEIAAVQLSSQVAIAGLELSSAIVQPTGRLRARDDDSDPTDLQASVESALQTVVNGVPQPPTDWATLISDQLDGTANELESNYALGSQYYSVAATQGQAALQYIAAGDLTNANIAYSQMLSTQSAGDVLFQAAAQSSVDAVDQATNVVEAIGTRSLDGLGILASLNFHGTLLT